MVGGYGLLLGIGVRLTAALGAAFAAAFAAYAWFTPAARSASDALRAEPRDLAGWNSNQQEVDWAAADPGSDIRLRMRMRVASFEAGDGFALWWEQDNSLAPISTRASFGERFAFGRPSARGSLQASPGSLSFEDRFRGESTLVDGTGGAVVDAPQKPVVRARTAAAMPRPDPRGIAVNVAKRSPNGGVRLASASETSLALAYAPADSAKSLDPRSLIGLGSKDSDSPSDVDTSRTAIYDITSRTVYLPNGRRLEAHSGLGSHLDNPRYVSMKSTGPTPPNVYDLKMRESLFHGVRAIRLIPQDESKMYGRDGILAHSYMLGPNGQSNGCLSFSDYQAFLDAFMRGEVTRLVVVERLADLPSRRTASDWLSNTLKDLFRPS
jgi:hypothetical protein